MRRLLDMKADVAAQGWASVLRWFPALPPLFSAEVSTSVFVFCVIRISERLCTQQRNLKPRMQSSFCFMPRAISRVATGYSLCFSRQHPHIILIDWLPGIPVAEEADSAPLFSVSRI